MKKKVNKITKRQKAQDKFVKGLLKLSEAFEKETKQKVVINYQIK